MPKTRKDYRITALQAEHERIAAEYSAIRTRRIALARILWEEGWTKDQLLKGMHTTPIWLKQAVPELYPSQKDEEPNGPPRFGY